jgi:hypothetical protein
MPRSTIAIVADGELDNHIATHRGTYDTVCGMDGGDEKLGMSTVPTTHKQITCQACRDIWRACRRVNPRQIKGSP